MGWACVAKGDIDGDGREDLLVCNKGGPSSIFLSNQPGDFTSFTPRAVVNKRWTWALLGDLDGDGKPDLVSLVDGSTVEVWLNRGTGAPRPVLRKTQLAGEPARGRQVADHG